MTIGLLMTGFLFVTDKKIEYASDNQSGNGDTSYYFHG